MFTPVSHMSVMPALNHLSTRFLHQWHPLRPSPPTPDRVTDFAGEASTGRLFRSTRQLAYRIYKGESVFVDRKWPKPNVLSVPVFDNLERILTKKAPKTNLIVFVWLSSNKLKVKFKLVLAK